MDRKFLQQRIAATKAQIIVYEDAVLALGTNGVQSYELDTGQTVQKVTKLNLRSLQDTVTSLYNRLATLQARCGGGTVTMRPGY